MSAGTIIGRVSVKVMPDTDDFRRDAQRKLDKIEKQLSADVKLRVDLEDTGVAEEAKAVRAKAQKQLNSITLQIDLENQQSIMKGLGQVRAQLDKLGEKPFPVSLDKESLNSAIKTLESSLAKVRTIDLQVDRKSMDSVKAAIAQIDRELAKIEEVTVPIKLDKASLTKARAEYELVMKKAAKVQLELDNRAAAAIRERIEAQLDSIPVSTKLNEASIAKTMRQIEGYLDQIEDLRAKITPELDDRARRKVERDIADLQDKIEDLKAEVKPETSKGALTLVWTQLTRLTKSRIVNIFPVVDKGAAATALAAINALSGARLLAGVFESFMQTLASLDKSLPLIGSITLAVLGLTGATISAASNMAALAASLASIAPAALLLPGLFAGMALGLGATFVALKDFNDVLPNVKQQLSELATQMSGNFWDAAKKPISDLIDNLFPAFSAGMKAVSTSVGEFFASFATSLQGAIGPNLLTQMFGDLTKSIDIAKLATGDLASIIAILGELGASYLPRLAQWFVDIVNKFEGWLSAAKDDGRLKEWVDNAITALNQLWTILKSVGSIFGVVASAATAAGGAGLGTLATTLSSIAAAAKDPVFQGQLTATFAAAHQMMDKIATTSGPALGKMFSAVAQQLTGILPTAGVAIGKLLEGLATAVADPAFLTGISSMVDGLKVGIAAMAPAIQSLAPVFGMLGQIVGALAAQLGPLIAAILPTLSAAFMAVLPSIRQLVTVLGGTLLGIFQQVLPALEPVIAMVGELLPQLVSELAPALAAIGQLIGQLLAAVIPLIPPLLQLAMAILPPLIQAIVQIVTTALPPFIAAVQRLVAALIPVITILTQVVGTVMSVLGPAIAWLAGILMDVLVLAVNAVAQVFEGVFNWIMGAWNVWAGIFTNDWDRVWAGVKQVFSGIWDVIVGLFKLVVAQFIAVWDNTAGRLGSVWSTCWNAIRSFFTNLWTGLVNWIAAQLVSFVTTWQARWNAVSSFFSSAWNGMVSYLRNAWTTLVAIVDLGIARARQFVDDGIARITTAFRNGWNQAVAAVRQGIDNAVALMRGLGARINSALGGIPTLLVNAGRQLIQGFINGIRGMFGDVRSTLGSLTANLTSWKGPESLDRVLLVDAGRLVIGGFIKGLESRYAEVRRSLRGLTDDIGGMAIDGPQISPVASRNLASQMAGALSAVGVEGPVIKQFNYYAAPGNSLDAEEDLFQAVGRSRWGW